MHITLDIGNSRVKVCTFDQDEIFHEIYNGPPSEVEIDHLLTSLPESLEGILVNTGVIPDGWLDLFRKRFRRFIHLGPSTPLPIENRYTSKNTLGYDRIAAVCGAHKLFPERDLLVIDAGTAVTTDLLTSTGVYSGGTIAPGILMRYRALAEFTARLPALRPSGRFPLVGIDTESAIISGVQNGILAEMDGLINRYREQYQDLTVVLTGGDSLFFEKNLKNSIFVRPNLIAIGLNSILDFNEKF